MGEECARFNVVGFDVASKRVEVHYALELKQFSL